VTGADGDMKNEIKNKAILIGWGCQPLSGLPKSFY
jgi:hypothetical protein